MGYKLFLDDIRNVSMVFKDLTDKDFVIVRNFEDFKKTIIERGFPEFISFDNDLGLDENGNVAKDGYDCCKWLIYERGLDLIELKFHVHSQNPVASVQIQSLLDNYIKFIKEENKDKSKMSFNELAGLQAEQLAKQQPVTLEEMKEQAHKVRERSSTKDKKKKN
jgi:hypothetical protein